MNPLWAYAAGGALLVGFAGGWQVQSWRCDSAKLAAVKSIEKQRDALAKALHDQAAAYEATRDQTTEESRNDEVRIRTVYRDRPVAAGCAAPDIVRGVLAEAVDRANSAAGGQSGSGLRGAPDAAGPVD